MDRRSQILLILFLLCIVVVTGWKYDTYIVRNDFHVYDHVSCDPAVTSCFVFTCEPDDEECDTEPFQKIEKNAGFIPECANHRTEACPELTCEPGEEDCTIISCSEDTLEDGEECIYEPVVEEAVEETDESIESEEEVL